MLHLHLETKKENMPFIEGTVVLFGKWIARSVSTSMTINIKKKKEKPAARLILIPSHVTLN